jgi:MFS family permease
MGSSIIQLIHGTFNTPGPVIAAFLFLQFGKVLGMRIIYLLMTSLYVAAAVLRLRLKETVTNGEPIRFRYFISSYPKAITESFRVWRVVPRTVLWLFCIRTLVMFGMSLTNVINALYARDILGIPEEQWYLVFIPLLLTMVVASIPIGKMVDKVGRKISLTLGLCVLGFGTAIFVMGDFITIIISMCLFGISHMLIMSGALALSADLVRPTNRGKVRGFNNFVGYIVMGLGMLLGSYLYETVIPQSPFILNLGVVTIAFIMVLLLIHEPERGPEQ